MKATLRSRLPRLLAGGALGLLLVLFWLHGQTRDRGPESGPGDYFLPTPIAAPDFVLTSQDGDRVSSRDFAGKVMVIFFGYTSCPDVCPLTLSNLTRAFGEMGENGERFQVLLITVDPDRDTPERLKRYLSNFHPSFLGLTGTEREIRAVADGFGAFFSIPSREGDYTVDHTARTFVVDTAGRIPLTFPVSATPLEMARDLGRLVPGPGPSSRVGERSP